MSDKKIVYSGIQPSGNLTLGNYIGALRNFPKLQEDYDCIYCIVDMHAITVPQEPKVLRAHTLDILALYLAVGIDPEKSILYIQSHVPQHVELMWLLNTMTGLGQLQRMTQFKAKAGDNKEVYAGLLNYPVLMAADILLYGSHYVPVGDDQKQHIEMTRDLAERFNSRYSDTFVLPEMLKTKVGGRVMSLQEPTKKMSKSDPDANGYVLILDDDATIRRKFKRAVTDSQGKIAYSDDQPGIKNLLDIYSACSGKSIEDLLKGYEGKGYGVLKEDVAEAVIQEIGPVRERFHEIRGNKAYLEEVYTSGAQKAAYRANKILRKCYKKMGFIPR